MNVKAPSSSMLLGRMFVHPWFDYLLIGGGLSLILIPLLTDYAHGGTLVPFAWLDWFILFSNSAHFAASTVRLYTKPGSREALPFLTMVFPLIALGVLSLSMVFADQTGPLLQATYLTWSPFHYGAQAYGLAVMYCYRSGCQLQPSHKNLLWAIAIIPFLRVLLQSADRHFIWWFLPDTTEVAMAPWSLPLHVLALLLGGLALILPFVAYFYIRRSLGTPMPLISLLVVVTNGIWFILFPRYNAYILATVFHGLQYLCIAAIFFVREQMQREDNRHGRLYHIVWFYGACVLLGYALFNCLPQAYMFLGFGPAESVLLVVAVVNIHHFIVDAFIWKLKPGDSNRKVIAATTSAL